MLATALELKYINRTTETKYGVKRKAAYQCLVPY